MKVYVVQSGCFSVDKPRNDDALSEIIIVTKQREEAEKSFNKEKESVITRHGRDSFTYETDNFVEWESDYLHGAFGLATLKFEE